MGLRLKTALIISCFFVAVISATYLLFSHVLMKEFDLIERERTEKNMSRVFEQLEVFRDDLTSRVIDWAMWDETYTFLAGKNPEYLESNMNYEALSPYELVHIAILDSKQRLVSGFQISAEKKEVLPLTKQAHSAIISLPAIAHFLNNPTSTPLQGIIVVDSTPLFVAVSAVTDNQRRNPSNGFLIFTRAFSSTLQAQVAKRTKLPLQFLPMTPSLSPPSSPHTTLLTTETEISAEHMIRDIGDTPILRVRFTTPREIYRQGQNSRDVMVKLMALFLVVANATLLLFLNQAVIGRLERFATRIKAITKTQDFSTRIPAEGRDEISTLTETFNSLLETTERSTLQLTEARNQAIRADSAKSAFIAHVSHELRTPIHSLAGILRILFKREESLYKRNLIQTARESSATLLATINDILDLSKIESGSLELQNIEFSLRDTIRASLKSVTHKIEEKVELSLLFDIHPGVPNFIIGDPFRLQQILVNLLGNAAKFTHEGSITLTVELDPGSTPPQLLIKVADTGTGIASDRLSKIFEPYKQADASIEARFAGTGLGLSIVKQLTEQLQGTISVESALGVGTTFSVYLPLNSAEIAIEPKASRSLSALIMGDGDLSAQFLADRLRRFGCTAHVLSDKKGPSAIREYLSQGAPDFIIVLTTEALSKNLLTDIQELTIHIDCPVLASVNDSDLSSLELLKEMPGITRVTKPISADEIIFLIRSGMKGERHISSDEQLSLSKTSSAHRLLVADDAPTSQLILREMLEEAGYSIDIVNDGLELVEKLKKSYATSGSAGVDVIITDVEMPRMNGLQASKAIRNLEREYNVEHPTPIIAITAHALLEQRKAMHNSGVSLVVPKPVTPNGLDEALKTFLDPAARSPSQSKIPARGDNHVIYEIVARFPPQNRSQDNNCGYTLDLVDTFERSGESLRRTKMILDSFLTAYTAPLAKLEAALEKGDLRSAVIPAHSIKGLLLDVGAKKAAQAAASIEAASRAGDGAGALSTHRELYEHVTSVVSLIEQVVKHPLLSINP
jgi:signal transduction histidine kinase/CheY-like chemotaxis protein/HPt (histidine-containing phosphotransfer) domain-containing protein